MRPIICISYIHTLYIRIYSQHTIAAITSYNQCNTKKNKLPSACIQQK